jgi:UDP-glucose 4-epimerase
VPETSANVRFDVESNLLPTIDLLEQMAKYSLNRIIYISSGGAVYGMSSERHKEIDETFPINSYGIVKVSI